MDNGALQSRGCISSTSTLTLTHDAPGGGSSVKPSEFINHVLGLRISEILSGEALAVGLLLWNQSREKWIGNKKPESQSQLLVEPKLSWNATYDSLLSSNKPFGKPIPLGEMIDFLVDIWEQEGMYD